MSPPSCPPTSYSKRDRSSEASPDTVRASATISKTSNTIVTSSASVLGRTRAKSSKNEDTQTGSNTKEQTFKQQKFEINADRRFIIHRPSIKTSDPSNNRELVSKGIKKSLLFDTSQNLNSNRSEQGSTEPKFRFRPVRPTKSVHFAPTALSIASSHVEETNTNFATDVEAKGEASIQPGMSSDAFMKDAWEEPKTVSTSAMSARTTGILKNPLAKTLDKQYKYLEYICQKGKAQAVRELLEMGCNPGTSKIPRPRPLIYGTKGATPQHYKCFRALVDKDVDFSITDRRGLSSLHLAIENVPFANYHSLVRDLVADGIHPNTVDQNGDYPLTKIFAGNETTPLEHVKLAALACLLQSDFYGGTNVNVAVRVSLQTPLHLAVRRRDAFAVGILLHKGANVNAPNASAVTPLLLAAKQWRGPLSQEQETLFELLLSTKDIAIDATAGSSQRTALLIAAAAGSSLAVRMLLEKGAKPDYMDGTGKNAIAIAMENQESMPNKEYEAIMDYLQKERPQSNQPQQRKVPKPTTYDR